MTTRVTRNSTTGVFNENKILNGKKHSNIPVTKRKAENEASKEGKKTSKRAALGDLTNANGKNVVTGENGGKSGLKSQMKKGLNTFVEKGRNTLRNTATRSSLRKKVVKEKEEKKEEASSSSSSEEGLACVLDSSDSGSMKTQEDVVEVFECPEPARTIPPEGVPDFDGETLGDPMQHSEYVMETFQYYKNREAEFMVGDYIGAQKEITEAKAQISTTEVEIKKASQNREKENAEFQTLVAEQRATQNILRKALTRLEDFYKKGKGKAALDQQTPPVQFNKQKDNAGASPVMGLLEQIIGDSDTLVKESSAAEYKAQADYETMVKDSTDLVAQLTASVVAKTKASAAAKKDASMAKSDHTSAVGELDALAAYNTDLHGQCDFLMKNFDIRQKARTQEIEAIQSAKGILSGDMDTE